MREPPDDPDRAASNGGANAATSYLICATPRSGGDVLSRLLWQTGVAGRPDEFFYEGGEPLWAASRYARYMTHLLQTRTTPNGVFGAMVMSHDLPRLVDKLRASYPADDSESDADLIARALPPPRYILVLRDVTAQSLAWSRAKYGFEEPSTAAERARVDERTALMRAQNADWSRWFRTNGAEAHRVSYEDLVADPETAILGVLEYLGVPSPPELALRLVGVDQDLPALPSPSAGLGSAEGPPHAEQEQPSRAFFICGMPRTGTALLAGLLASTRYFGRAEEYFKADAEPLWAEDDYGRYVRSTARSTAVKGVFAAKFVDRQLWRFLERLRADPAHASLSDRELLDELFTDLRFVWLRREDTVAQAVSWWKAFQTDEWWSNGTEATRPARSPVFDFERIDELVREARAGNERWERWFEDTGFEPLRLAYEELDADHAGCGGRALEFLGVDVPDGIRIRPQSIRQADDLNDEWAARYRAMAGERVA